MMLPANISSLFLNISRLLLADRPIFAQLSASLAKIARPDLSCIFALGWHQGRPLLYYQPDRLLLWKDQPSFLADCLQEELMHLLLRHPAQQTAFHAVWAFHLAADLEVLQYLPATVQADRFTMLVQRLQLPQPWSLDALYERLLQLEQANKREQLYRWQAASPISRSAHANWVESWHVNDQNVWQSWWEEQSQLLKSLYPADALLRQLRGASAGADPQNWQIALQRFTQNGARTILQSTHRRPSKRYGTLPGTRRQRQTRLLVIIDTSGSVDQALLTSFFSQLQYLHRQQTIITVVEADHQVRKTYSWNGRIPETAHGGGYTDFNPALAYANAHGPFDGIVYFTDGKANIPTVIPGWPLLWLMAAGPDQEDWSDWPGSVTEMRTLS